MVFKNTHFEPRYILILPEKSKVCVLLQFHIVTWHVELLCFILVYVTFKINNCTKFLLHK